MANMNSGPHNATPDVFPITTPSGEHVGEVWFASDEHGPYMARTPFINNFRTGVALGHLSRLIAAAKRGDWEALDRVDGEALPWYCRECRRNYAERDWHTWPAFEDDGWVDSYRGRCPNGHQRMIAD